MNKKVKVRARVHVREDRVIFVLYPNDEENSSLDEIEMTEELYDRYKRIQKEYETIQDKIYKLYYER